MKTTLTRVAIPNRFGDKVALVTGGTTGIGYAVAIELLREGASVVVSGLPEDVEEGRRSFAAAGYSPLIVSGDLQRATVCRDLVAQTLERHGRIDFLVNNAFSFLST
ncbi:MAG TPA: SDR family NAD(P)-dependent oxidoreductase [Planctomycetaceae bacterium]|nr:SDR family NAD(P)-dependent oxidoreductase [Planctomycetaceae bacterium]